MANPLVSSHPASDAGLRVLLHPLVLLSVSDHITRHALRRLDAPVVGGLLGRQNGRDISLELAFEAKLNNSGSDVVLDESWFTERVMQHQEVHKNSSLDLMGWFTVTPASGPQPRHLPINRQVLEADREGPAVLLAFHPSEISTGAKLPLTIYESVYEGGEEGMQIDGEEHRLKLRFRELPYSIETGEAEMIGVDFVARGGGNATATNAASKTEKDEGPNALEKGKARNITHFDTQALSSVDEELISSLTAKANAIKMLHSRIQLLTTYLEHLPPSYLTVSSDGDRKPQKIIQPTEINHTILRSIQALVKQLPLLTPSDRAAFEQESLAEKNDVYLVSLLGTLGRSVVDAREMGQKFAIVESQKQAKRGLTGDGIFSNFNGILGETAMGNRGLYRS